MNRFFSTLLASSLGLAALGGAASHAQAASALGNASISQLKIELIDLDLNDNITPWINFTNTTHELGVYRNTPEKSQWAGSGPITLYGSDGNASASTSATGVEASVGLYSSRDYQLYFGLSSSRLHFTLSPWTKLQVSAVGALSGWVDQGARSSPYVTLATFLYGPQGPVNDLSTMTYDKSESGYGTRSLFTSVDTAELSQSGQVFLNANASAWVSVPGPVPEPSTYGMLLIGAGIIGAAARRTARKQRG